MKTIHLFRKKPLVTVCMGLAIFILVACHKNNDSTVDNRPYTISGNASGSQVVPAVPDSGNATITGTYNPATRVLNYTSNWTGLSGTPVAGGLYTGALGASGIAVGQAWVISGGPTGTVTGNINLTDNQASQLLTGNIYYTYATINHPGGEVRGQISVSR
ncbi:MAG: CHRD domain-containing protein [Bacteroidota bacterium]